MISIDGYDTRKTRTTTTTTTKEESRRGQDEIIVNEKYFNVEENDSTVIIHYKPGRFEELSAEEDQPSYSSSHIEEQRQPNDNSNIITGTQNSNSIYNLDIMNLTSSSSSSSSNNATATSTYIDANYNGGIDSNSSISNNNSKPNANTNTVYATTYTITPIGYFMITLVIATFTSALTLVIYKLHRRRQLRIQFEQGYTPRRKATKLRIQRRYETIEHWIITKRVQQHDNDFCPKVVSNFAHHNHRFIDHAVKNTCFAENSQQNNSDPTKGTVPSINENVDNEKNKFTLASADESFNNGIERELTENSKNNSEDITLKCLENRDAVESSVRNTKTITTEKEVTALLNTTMTTLDLSTLSEDEVIAILGSNDSITCKGNTANTYSEAEETETEEDRKKVVVNMEQEDENQHRLEHAASVEFLVRDRITNNNHADDDDDDEEEDNIIHNSYEDEEIEERECPVCMSPLNVEDVVSWSANTLCNHVYHHECIKEWLLRHTDCCLCKQIMLPVDEKRGKAAKQEALQELSSRYAAAASTSYYCIQEGLIRIPKTVRCTRKELKQLEHRIFHGTVPPADLVTLRGRRQEQTNTGREDDDDNLEINIVEATTSINNTSEPFILHDNNEDQRSTARTITSGEYGLDSSSNHSPISGYNSNIPNSNHNKENAAEDIEAPSSPTMLDQQGMEIVVASTTHQRKSSTIRRKSRTPSPRVVSQQTSPNSPTRLSPSSNASNCLHTDSPSNALYSSSKGRRSRCSSSHNASPASTATIEFDEECGTSDSMTIPLPPSLVDDSTTMIPDNNYNSKLGTERSAAHPLSLLVRSNNASTIIRATVARSNDDESTAHHSTGANSSSGGSSSTSSSASNELVMASSLLEQSNVIGDNRCHIVENKNSFDANEEGVEVSATVSLPVYEE